MRILIRPAVTIAALALALPAAAAAAPVREGDAAVSDVARDLADPVRQQALAKALGAMAEVLLDVPLAPIIGPLAEAAGDAVGEPVRRVDPDATLRKISPGAAAVPRQIERQLPRAMGAMAGMSDALAGVLPQLRAAAERMREALPAERP